MIRVRFGPEWDRAVRALGIADKTIPRQQRDLINETAEEAVRAAQRRLVGMPVRGQAGSNATRYRIASGTRWHRRRNQIRVHAPSGLETVAWGFQAAQGWRHPVFGNENVWVQQVHNWDWFYGPIHETFQNTPEEMHRQLERVALMIDRMTNGH